MEFENYKSKFIKAAINAHFSEQEVHHCLEYAKKLFTNSVPIIYNVSHLSELVGYSKEYLQRASVHTPYFYRQFQIPKKNGSTRKITEPLPSLKEIQLWILNSILYKVPVSPFAKAYKPNVSMIENVKFHRNQHKVLTLDIVDFFSAIKMQNVEQVFIELGYSKLLSSLLARLCCKSKVLPQGAPTSPYLSNLFFRPIDDLIAEYCMSRKIRYTRYADDLTFSGDFDENKVIKKISTILRYYNLNLNKEKTALRLQNSRQIVTGIVVNEKLQVPFEKRNSLRQSLYYIKKFGIEEHCKHIKNNKQNYLEHLLGQIQFILCINPKDNEFQEYKTFLTELKTSKVDAQLLPEFVWNVF